MLINLLRNAADASLETQGDVKSVGPGPLFNC